MIRFFMTLRKIRSTPQYLTWTYLKFSTQRKQYFYSQVALFFLMTVFCLVNIIKFDRNKIIYYTTSQFVFFVVIIITSQVIQIETMEHRIYQVLTLLCFASNQFMLLSIPHQQQMIHLVMTGYLLGWTTYNLPELEFRFLFALTSCGTCCYLNSGQQNYVLAAFLLIQITGALCLEYNLLTLYLKYLSLFSIIDRIPNALCIVDKNVTQLIYSNKNFKNLTVTLNQNFHGDFVNQSDYCEQKQLNFLQNLTSSQTTTNEENWQLSDILSQTNFEGITKEQSMIKQVFFNKNKSKRNSFHLPRSNQRTKPNFFDAYKQELHSLVLGQVYNINIRNKTFIAEVKLEIEIQNDPLKQIRQNYKRKLKLLNQTKPNKQTQYLSLSPKRIQKSPSTKSNQLVKLPNYNQIVIAEQFQQSTLQKDSYITSPIDKDEQQKKGQQFDDSNISQIQHKMKFMVQLMENCNSFYLEEQLQIYFISELSPFILKTKVKKLEQVQKNLLRSISHELVTYLNGAFGYMNQVHQKMQQGKYDKEKVLKLVTLSIQYISLQIHKIQDLNDFKALLSGQFLLNNECFFLNQVIEECIDLMKDQSIQKGITLELMIDTTLPLPLKIKCDRQRLCQIILNLLSNAMRFTYEGGIIVQIKKADLCDLSNIDEETQSVYMNVDLSNMVEINVIDTGLGMEKDQLGKLTQKLLTVSHGEKISKDSIGISMGLMLCKQILSIMGPDSINTLFVKSIKNQGSSFYFYLKLLIPEFEENAIISDFKSQSSESFKLHHSESIKANQIKVCSPPHSSLHNNNFRYSLKPSDCSFTFIKDCQCNQILIVDDESFNIDILSYLVIQMGFDTEAAFNGKQCVEKLNNKMENHCQYIPCCLYKCILMDINMPVMNGWQAALKIQQIQQLRMSEYLNVPKIPVIAVTAFGDPQDQKKCLQSGFDYVIVKPASRKSVQAAFKFLNIIYVE